MKNNSVLRTYPVVCAVRKNYVICVPVKKNVLMKLEVNGKFYYYHSNGIRISSTDIQKFTVPMKELDKAKKYKLIYEIMDMRGAYHCIKRPEAELSFSFRSSADKEELNIYHLSDTHGIKTPSIKTGEFFGKKLDLLILNGDISSSSETVKEVMLPFEIASGITKGECPVIISRGNHDLRGKMAEKLENYMPTDNGKTYYPVKLGPLWCVLLDCGEDKNDSHREYSGTVCCHEFRLEESAMLNEIKKNAKKEYDADTVKYKMILSHVPFSFDNREDPDDNYPFDIEHEIFSDWCNFAKHDVKAQFQLSGHYHSARVEPVGSSCDCKHIEMPVIIGGYPDGKNNNMVGTALTLSGNKAYVKFTDSNKQILKETEFDL